MSMGWTCAGSRSWGRSCGGSSACGQCLDFDVGLDDLNVVIVVVFFDAFRSVVILGKVLKNIFFFVVGAPAEKAREFVVAKNFLPRIAFASDASVYIWIRLLTNQGSYF